MRIPIRNLYYLLCYAWNHLEHGEIADVSRVECNSLVDLFAMVLCDGVEHVARRGMQQGYRQAEEELTGLRGRIDVVGSARKLLLAHGRALCRFDDLSADTHANRIIKATLRSLLAATEDSGLQKRVRRVYASLGAISDIRLSRQLFQSLQLGSNERFYRFLIHVCDFVFSAWLVDSQTGQRRFRDFVRDERVMARVFEDFLLNFLRLELKTWHVGREDIAWHASSVTDVRLSLLPRMRTDVTLRQDGRCRIVDAKYYADTMSNYFAVEKLHGSNLYQLMSYVSNAHAVDPRVEVSGMLIYPRVDRSLRERYSIRGHAIDVCTVDLAAEWQDIRGELLSFFRD